MKAFNWALSLSGLMLITNGFFLRADEVTPLSEPETDLAYPFFCSLTSPGPFGTGCFGQLCLFNTCKLGDPMNGTPIYCECR